MSFDSTIFALSTAPGRAGVAVIRISGPNAKLVLDQMMAKPPAPRMAELVVLRHPASNTVLDQSLALYFPNPNSFTGEDVVELHTHGGRAVIQAVLQALASLPNFRAAEPGEFTRRAFDNDKMDLTQVEGLADLIHADTEAQRKQALRQMDGELGRLYDGWREDLMRSLAHLEAYLDFPDEDIDPATYVALQQKIVAVQQSVQRHLSDAHRGERLRDGLYAAIIGPPNAGKSSLLNMLAKREAAIVSDIAGTTRDVIEVSLDLGGYPLTLADTAGIREASDRIEQEGVRRSKRAAAEADFKILVLDSADPAPIDPQLQQLADRDCIVVWNKTDDGTPKSPPFSLPQARAMVPISTKTGYNLDRFLGLLLAETESRLGGGDGAVITRLRHRSALEAVDQAITRFVVADLPELAAEDLRSAVHALGSITGRVDVEDILDIVFRDFCIGK